MFIVSFTTQSTSLVFATASLSPFFFLFFFFFLNNNNNNNNNKCKKTTYSKLYHMADAWCKSPHEHNNN